MLLRWRGASLRFGDQEEPVSVVVDGGESVSLLTVRACKRMMEFNTPGDSFCVRAVVIFPKPLLASWGLSTALDLEHVGPEARCQSHRLNRKVIPPRSVCRLSAKGAL